jgi:hypothetical protein
VPTRKKIVGLGAVRQTKKLSQFRETQVEPGVAPAGVAAQLEKHGKIKTLGFC